MAIIWDRAGRRHPEGDVWEICGEIWQGVKRCAGRYGKIWRDVDPSRALPHQRRYGEMCWEMWGDIGSYGEISEEIG